MAEKSPLANLITEGREGRLTVRMEPEEFAILDKECLNFQEVIRDIQTDMKYVSGIETWGFGDNGKFLTSAPTMAKSFREKSKGGSDDFHTVLEEHWAVVEDIRLMHAAVRDRFIAADDAWASRYQTKAAELDGQK